MANTLLVVALLVALVAVIGLAAAAVLRFRDTVLRRLAMVEQRLTALMDHFDVSLPPAQTDEIVAQLAKGRQAEAVKLYRQRTGAGLLEAKRAVDEIARQQGRPRK